MLSTDVKVILLSVLNAALVAGGGAFQRLNAQRNGHPIWSGWMLLAIVCLAPSFLVVSWAYSIGGKMSLFVPVTAVGYIFSLLLARFAFDEKVGGLEWLGCAIVIVGVAITARPR